jgi:hypothetical protein
MAATIPSRSATGPKGIVVIEIALRSAYGDSSS